MRRTPIVVTAVAIALALIGSSVGYLFLELGQANADLQETREALTQSRADRTAVVEAHNALVADVTALYGSLAEAEGDRDRLRGEVHELSEQNRTLAHEKSVLTQEYVHLQGAHEQLTADHQQLGVEHEALQVVRQDLQERNETLTTELGDANAQVAMLSTEKLNLETLFGDLREDHVELQSNYLDLDTRHTALTQAAGTVETLEEEAGALRTEITQLEERRKPLILSDERVNGFKCTGSMEPKLTCLDTATWLYDFKPEEVVVGATIAFRSQACWSNRPSDRRTAHRVLDVRVVNGVYEYWPQGDANERPDGCWVPHTAVSAYIIEIHKNTRPENATLRDNVNAARAAYLAARDTYFDLRQSHGCQRDRGTCYVAAGAPFDTLNAAYQRFVQAYDYYYDCWLRNARDSEFPGHIPYSC